MANFCGKEFLLQFDENQDDNWLTVGGCQSNSLTINNEQVDVTEKGTMPWRQLRNCGLRTMSLSGSGIAEDDATLQKVEELARTGELGRFRMISGRTDWYDGLFQVASFERTGDHTDAEKFSFTLESGSDINYQPPAAP